MGVAVSTGDGSGFTWIECLVALFLLGVGLAILANITAWTQDAAAGAERQHAYVTSAREQAAARLQRQVSAPGELRRVPLNPASGTDPVAMVEWVVAADRRSWFFRVELGPEYRSAWYGPYYLSAE